MSKRRDRAFEKDRARRIESAHTEGSRTLDRPARSAIGSSGLVWFLSLMTGPLFGFLIGSPTLIPPSPTSWQWRLYTWIALGAVFPLLAVLVHMIDLRLRGSPNDALLVFTLLVAATTYPAVRRLVEGTRTRDVLVVESVCDQYGRKSMAGKCLRRRVTIDGGMKLEADPDVTRGLKTPVKARLLTLDDQILSAEVL